ncbi:MAG: helix-turn-helix transcriptional regulator [Lentisphaeria bacterium]
MEKNSLAFENKLTADIRTRLKEKRIQLGLTYLSLSKFFEVNWSTIRKWELGPTITCNITKFKKLIAFIHGDYDDQLKEGMPICPYSENNRLPGTVRLCMERLSNTYMICKNNEDLKQQLIENVNQTTCEILQDLISISPPQLSKNELDELF